jgi:hypothetical protein
MSTPDFVEVLLKDYDLISDQFRESIRSAAKIQKSLSTAQASLLRTVRGEYAALIRQVRTGQRELAAMTKRAQCRKDIVLVVGRACALLERNSEQLRALNRRLDELRPVAVLSDA